jgi:collagenase-like PrtC family protease
MALSVGTNWDPEFVRAAARFEGVTDFYGSMARQLIGSGRPYANLPKVTREEVAEHVRLVRSLGRTFTWLMNAPGVGGREVQPDFMKQYLAEVEWLVSIGIEALTLAIPLLIEVTRERFPKLRIKASYNCKICTVDQALAFERLGADELVVHQPLHRDFATLRAVCKAVHVPVQAIPTVDCVRGCPNMSALYHMNNTCAVNSGRVEFGRFSRHGGAYCLGWCQVMKVEHPAEILKGGIIRPEDLACFEEAGVASFKLDTRVHTTPNAIRIVEAYATRRFDGNLVDLASILPLGFKNRSHELDGRPQFGDTDPDYAAFFALKWDFPFSRMLVVDNRKLDGFLERFVSHPCPPSCVGCAHCQTWADRAVTVDQELKERFVRASLTYRKALSRSTFVSDRPPPRAPLPAGGGAGGLPCEARRAKQGGAAPSNICLRDPKDHTSCSPDWPAFRRSLETLSESHEGFTCLFDAPFMDTAELDLETQRWLIDLFKEIERAGAAQLVLANPFLMELARRHVPRLRLVASWRCRVSDPFQAAHLAGLGVSAICLEEEVLADEKLAEAIAKVGGVPVRGAIGDAHGTAGLQPCGGPDPSTPPRLARPGRRHTREPVFARSGSLRAGPDPHPHPHPHPRGGGERAGEDGGLQLSVGTNWDPQLVERLRGLDNVADLFGALPRSVLGGGRPAGSLPDLSKAQAAEHIGQARKAGFGFSYVMNAPDLFGREDDQTLERDFLAEVEWAAGAGANQVILTLPRLMALVAKHFPGLRIKASSAVQTTSAAQAVELERLGVHSICLHPSRNRDFALIREIAAAVRAELMAIADVHCVTGCPFSATLYHSAACAVHSRESAPPSPRQAQAVTYCTSWCHEVRLRNPVELVRYPFIRPEDQRAYGQAGVIWLKLATRPMTTERIMTKVQAYRAGRFDGNLLDIVNVFPALMETRRNELAAAGAGAGAGAGTGGGSGAIRQTVPVTDIVRIDNRKLDGLLDRFLEHSCPPGCLGCRHCHDFAAAAVRMDEAAAALLADRFAQHRAGLVEGDR